MLRYSWTKMANGLGSKVLNTDEQWPVIGVIYLASGFWLAYCDRYEKLFPEYVSFHRRCSAEDAAELHGSRSRATANRWDAIAWLSSRISLELYALHKRYYLDNKRPEEMKTRWPHHMKGLRKQQEKRSPATLKVLDYPWICQPRWASRTNESTLNLPQMPWRIEVPTCDYINDSLANSGSPLLIDFAKPVDIFGDGTKPVDTFTDS